MTCILIPLKRVSADSRDIDFATKVTREITEVSSLLDDGSSAKSEGSENISGRWCLVRTSLTCPTNQA